MSAGYCIKVIDHTTGKTYRSLEEASKDLCVVASTLSSRKKKQGYRFDLYDHDIELIETKLPARLQKVRCVETGEVYESMTAAEKALGLNRAMMSAHLRGRVKNINGHHFRKV